MCDNDIYPNHNHSNVKSLTVNCTYRPPIDLHGGPRAKPAPKIGDCMWTLELRGSHVNCSRLQRIDLINLRSHDGARPPSKTASRLLGVVLQPNPETSPVGSKTNSPALCRESYKCRSVAAIL